MGIIIASASEIRGEVPTGCPALMKMPVLLSIPLNPQAVQSGTQCRERRFCQLWDLGMFALCEESRSRLEERKAEGIEPWLSGRNKKLYSLLSKLVLLSVISKHPNGKIGNRTLWSLKKRWCHGAAGPDAQDGLSLEEEKQPKLMRRLHPLPAHGSEWLAHDHDGGAAIFWL